MSDENEDIFGNVSSDEEGDEEQLYPQQPTSDHGGKSPSNGKDLRSKILVDSDVESGNDAFESASDEDKQELLHDSKNNLHTSVDGDEDHLDRILGKEGKFVTSKKERSSSTLFMGHAMKLPAQDRTFYVKTPKFLKIQPKLYDPRNYNPEDEREKFDTASAVIRWKYDDAGNDKLLSNARLLRWDDGSFQLVVGNTVFNAKIAPSENCQIYEQLQCRRVIDSNQSEDADEVDGSSEIHCTCLECCGPVSRRFIFEPSSLDSDAHFLINQRNSERFKSDKKSNTMDQDKLQQIQARNQQQASKLDERRRSLAKQRKKAIDSAPKRYSFSSNRPYMNESYLEDDDYEDDEDLPRKSTKKVSRRRHTDEDSFGEDIDENEERSGDEDDGDDLGDFIEKDEDEGEEDFEEKSADDEDSDAEDEEEVSGEEEEAEDEDDEDDDEGMDEFHDGDENKKAKAGKSKKGKVGQSKPIKSSKSLKRKASSTNGDSDPIVEQSEAQLGNGVLDVLEDEDEDDVVVHQNKKQRKIFVESDDE